MAGINHADRVLDRNFSIPHRAPPQPPHHQQQQQQHHHHHHHYEPQYQRQPYPQQPQYPQPQYPQNPHPQHTKPPSSKSIDLQRPTTSGGGAGASASRRRGSFSSFLRRSSSQTRGAAERVPDDAPPIPRTRIEQAYIEAAQQAPDEPRNSRKDTSVTSKMMRKSSRMKKAAAEEEAENVRQARAKAPPPQLPTPSFGAGVEQRESAAFFDDPYSTPNSTSHADPSHPLPPHATTTNFSRPGNTHFGSTATAMPSSSDPSSSSSPAYAVRSGNAFAQQQASSSSSYLNGRTGSVSQSNGNGEYVPNNEPAARSESMTNRGRYSYASSSAPVNVSSPRRVRRRKDPTPFNVLVIGTKNCGKTSLITFLRNSLALPAAKQSGPEHDTTVNASKSPFNSSYVETEMDGERVGLTLLDSAGLEKHIIDLQLREMTSFVESKFEETFVEEQKVMRAPGIKDTHIHCVFYVLDPVRLDATVAASAECQKNGVHLPGAGLDDEVDLQVLRALWGKTTAIPIIAKADTLTTGHMAFLKRAVWESMKGAKLDPLEALELEDDLEEVSDEDEEENEKESPTSDSPNNDAASATSSPTSTTPPHASSSPLPMAKSASNKKPHSRHPSTSTTSPDEPPYLPLSLLTPDPFTYPPYTAHPPSHPVRSYPWGAADPFDPQHSDYPRLRDSVFAEWRTELRDLSRGRWYEGWRTSRLNALPGGREAKMRVRGGVTPVGSVPREGRGSSGGFAGGGGMVPRAVSGGSAGVHADGGEVGGGGNGEGGEEG